MFFWYEWMILLPALVAVICLVIALICVASKNEDSIGWLAVSITMALFTIMLHYEGGCLVQNSESDYKLAAFVGQKSTDISELLFVYSRGMYTTVKYEGDLIADEGIYRNAIRAYNELKYIEKQKIAQQEEELVAKRLDNLLGHSPLEEEQ